MKRELVKCLRTVALLAMFSQDSNTVSNIQSCLKSMSFMEPDLILDSILERAVPSLEALVEVRTFDFLLLAYFMLESDAKDHCCDQGFGCCSAGYRLATGLLSWCQAPRTDIAVAYSWNRSCKRALLVCCFVLYLCRRMIPPRLFVTVWKSVTSRH